MSSSERSKPASRPSTQPPGGSRWGGGLSFSHIYVEKAAREYEDAARILSLFPRSRLILIDDYKEVFSRPNQSFQLQKSDNKLILAVKKDKFLYRGTERINSFGDRFLHYNSLIRNCLFNCDYCFLQGMHPSAYIVVYVNGEDFFSATDAQLEQGPLYLSISYLTDLLGFEGLLPFCRRWVEFARSRPSLTIEMRTKSDNYRAIRDLEPIPNAILSWTMSPQAVAARYERGTASFKNRLFALKCAVEDGWRVRVCFDPLVRFEGWEDAYSSTIAEIFERVGSDSIEEFSVGVLRMSSSYLKSLKASGTASDILIYPFHVSHGAASYPPEEEREMRELVRREICRFTDAARVTFVGG